MQKIKNQVLASSVRRLKRNLGLMFQLGMYDTWFDWRYINDSPRQMLAVTADDVRRVVNEYFDPKTRTVSIYRTKGGTATERDPELEAVLATVPPERLEQTRAMMKRITESNDVNRLSSMLKMMEQGLSEGQIPDDQRPAFEYMLNILRARVAKLGTAKKVSD